jgi:hypothetical protein
MRKKDRERERERERERQSECADFRKRKRNKPCEERLFTDFLVYCNNVIKKTSVILYMYIYIYMNSMN